MNSTSRNIELFNSVVAITLLRLYESFPNPLQIDSADIGAEAAKDIKDEGEIFQLITQTTESSIDFLVQEGFVRYAETLRTLSDVGIFPNARLTLKGFTLLGTIPQAVDGSIDRRPYIEQLKSAVAGGARAAIPEIIKSLFTAVIVSGAGAVGIG